MITSGMLNSIAEDGILQLSDHARWWLESGFESIKRRLAPFVLDELGLTLDVGCGTGLLTSLFSDQAYLGIDVSRASLNKAKRRNPNHRFRLMDATCIDLPNGAFDLAVVVGVLHHLSDSGVAAVCENLGRVVKSSGTILIVEDVPIRRAMNWIGRAVQCFDNGEFIRRDDAYHCLIRQDLTIERHESFESGFMEYAMFSCRPRNPRRIVASNYLRPLSTPSASGSLSMLDVSSDRPHQ